MAFKGIVPKQEYVTELLGAVLEEALAGLPPQTPLTQATPGEQKFPQLPQFLASVCLLKFSSILQLQLLSFPSQTYVVEIQVGATLHGFILYACPEILVQLTKKINNAINPMNSIHFFINIS